MSSSTIKTRFVWPISIPAGLRELAVAFKLLLREFDSLAEVARRMNSLHEDLATALRERRRIVTDAASRRDPAQHMERLRAVSEKITTLGNSLPRPVDPQLAHYLAKCSFDKALAFLEGNPA